MTPDQSAWFIVRRTRGAYAVFVESDRGLRWFLSAYRTLSAALRDYPDARYEL